ncbi:hypothetical protein [Parasulfitobacter algicola]|uniref:YARHG domain-containing protein n=1 Tax=Parasulfitobacter algicola TaxID=2614809 RepID=A0ABX2IX63_9RHOB|nr:hypothetical protein [Sulfitobacter algicola]NSX57020.1 hypothetical protein [Sulfitobacter algicola]
MSMIYYNTVTLAFTFVISLMVVQTRAEDQSPSVAEITKGFERRKVETICTHSSRQNCDGSSMQQEIPVIPHQQQPETGLQTNIVQPRLLSGPPWPQCHSIYEITTDMTPVYLNEQIIACAQAKEFQNMGEMVIAMEIFYTFDMKRLQLNERRAFEFQMEPYRRSYVSRRDYIQSMPHRDRLGHARRSDPIVQQQICNFFNELGPPTNDLSWTNPIFEYLETSPNPSSVPKNTLWIETLDEYFRCNQLRK